LHRPRARVKIASSRTCARNATRRFGEMAAVYIQEFPIVGDDRSTTNYDSVAQRLGASGGDVEGLIVHTAGFDEDAGVFRIMDVWESRDQGERFMKERLQPILDELMPQMAEGSAAPPEREAWYELHDVIK
jgi:hypothetical protein